MRLREIGYIKLGFGANSTTWLVENTTQGNIVGRIEQSMQVCESILDFRTLIESGSSHNEVRNSSCYELLFHQARLCIRAVHNGNIGIRNVLLGANASNLFGDEASLTSSIISCIADDFVTRTF